MNSSYLCAKKAPTNIKSNLKFGLLFAFICGLTLNLMAKNFKNISELIAISSKNPSNLEKALIAKDYIYVQTKDGRFEFSSKFNEGTISYELAPRVLQFNFKNRQFYLDAFSSLQKLGYSLSKGEVESIIEKKKFKAEMFVKESTKVFLNQETKKNGTETYSILIYPGEDALVKPDCSYGNFFSGLMLPKGMLAQAPSPNQSFEKAFTGNSGLGAGTGYEFGFSGLIGFVNFNQKLPEFIDFGLHMEAVGGFQPYALSSKDYKYKSFQKFGVGAGPALSLKPFSNSDFRFSVFYDFFASGNGGGNISYTGSVPNYTQTITRKMGSFAMIKSLGFELKYESIFIGLGFSNYTDKGVFEKKAGFTGSVATTEIKASMEFKQTILKFGFIF